MFLEGESVTGYTLARHPRNRAIVDIRIKTTNELKYIKVRHRLANFYAMSLVDPKTFEVWAETQVKSASTSLKPITLHGYKNSVPLKDTSIFGFEWSFEWENQKYKWVRESPMRPTLECRAVVGGRSSNICVARYLPRGIKDEYFGLITILDDTLAQVEDGRAMNLLLITSLMTILDKANDNSWKKEKSSGSLFLEPSEIPTIHHPDTSRGAKFGYENVNGMDSDYGDGSGNSSSNNDDGKQYDGMIDTDRGKLSSTNEQQQQQQQKSTTVSDNIGGSAMQQSIDDNGKIGYASHQQQPIRKDSGSLPAHDLRSHNQRQQVEHLGHMLSTMKHLENATATLPPSFVQHTTTTSWAHENIENGRQSLQTIWHENNYRNTNTNNDSNNNHHQKQHYKYNDILDDERQQAILHSMSSSSRRYNNQHHRTRSYRRLPSSIDPSHWLPFSRQRQPPPASTFRNSLNLQHPIPEPHKRYYLN